MVMIVISSILILLYYNLFHINYKKQVKLYSGKSPTSSKISVLRNDTSNYSNPESNKHRHVHFNPRQIINVPMMNQGKVYPIIKNHKYVEIGRLHPVNNAPVIGGVKRLYVYKDGWKYIYFYRNIDKTKIENNITKVFLNVSKELYDDDIVVDKNGMTLRVEMFNKTRQLFSWRYVGWLSGPNDKALKLFEHSAGNQYYYSTVLDNGVKQPLRENNQRRLYDGDTIGLYTVHMYNSMDLHVIE